MEKAFRRCLGYKTYLLVITGQGSVGGADTPRISFKNSAITFMVVIVTPHRIVNKAK